MTDNKSLPISTRNYKQILKEFTAMYSQMIDEQSILHSEKIEK